MVEGHPSLPVGAVFLPLRVQDWCWFGLVRSAEGLFQEPKEVCATGVWPGHGLQCGSLGGVVGDQRLVEDVDVGMGFRRRWLLGICGRGSGTSSAGAPSGVEEVNDTLSCGRLGAPLLRLWQGPCVVDFARVLVASELLCVWGAQLYGDHLTNVLLPPEFDGSPHLLVIAAGWVPLDVDLESLVLPRDAVPIGDLTRGPYPCEGASVCGVLEGQLNSGTDGVVRV